MVLSKPKLDYSDSLLIDVTILGPSLLQSSLHPIATLNRALSHGIWSLAAQ